MVGVASIGILGLQGAAGADSGYPGTTTTVGSANQTGPSQTPGSSFSGTVCGFAPGSTVTFSVGGASAGTATAGSNGCDTFTGAVSNALSLTINGGTPIPVTLGTVVITASGTSSTGGTQSSTYTFQVVKTAAATGLAFTGADIMAMVGGGLALIALGYLVVAFARRRRTA